MDQDIGRCTDEVKGCGLPIESAHNAKEQQTILPPAVDGEQCKVQSQSDGRGSRKRERSGGDSMECTSKSESQASGRKKQASVATKDGAILCHSLVLSDEKLAAWSQIDVAREITRCLQEPKFHLVKDVVNVLGTQKAVELFHKTAAIQESGGQLAADGGGKKKKSPGGVYFALVKTVASSNEKREIFRVDKLQKERRKKTIKKKSDRAKQLELTKRKADWQLKVFRAQLENPFHSTSELEWNIAHRLSSECDTTYTQLKRRPKNIHKRLGKKLEASLRTDDGAELMEVECNCTCNSQRDSTIEDGSPGDSLERERQAAEQFELMVECNMDFDLDLT